MISAREEGEHTQLASVNAFRTEPVKQSVRLNVANETRVEVRGVVRWALRNAHGEVLRDGTQAITVAALSALWLEELLFPEASATEHYVSYSFETGSAIVSEGCALFCAPKHFAFHAAQLTASADGDTITVQASAFAKAVCIQSEDPDLLLTDNYFDMNPGTKIVRVLRGSANQLRVRCVESIVRL